MLIECAECGHKISDRADSCPHCGYPVLPAAEKLPAKMLPIEKGERRTPVFVIIALCALILSLTTPRLLLFFPIMCALAFAVIALVRREKAPLLALLTIAGAIGLVVLNEADLAAPTSSNLTAAQITDWNWQRDSSFGSRGTIKWNVVVRNTSNQNIRNAKVEFTTYDKSGKLVSSTFTYVDAIPTGQSRSANSFADLYGTEVTARTQLAEVHFAN